MEERGFKELNITPCSHQTQLTRYPPQAGAKAPTCLGYRNNLAALSQRRNLLFIAYVDKVHIFKPQLPAQIIPGKPELVLSLPRTRQGIRGYIIPGVPHAINQIIVADLGIEEVLVAACDGGDVIAYSVRSICNAIREKHESNDAGLPYTTGLRTLLLTNVGISAWGLAVHKAARLIAVSSNHHRISVFAFSLHQKNSESLCDEDVFPKGLGYVFWDREERGPCSPHDRSRNVEIVLKGHMENIPNIAFCNTGADPTGNFLISTDISGITFVWSVWEKKIIARFKPGFEGSKSSGWGVTCWDFQTYHLGSSIQETYGCEDVGEHKQKNDSQGTEYDNSASSQSVHDSSTWHPSFAKFAAAQCMALAQGPVFSSDADSNQNSDLEEYDETESESEDTELEIDLADLNFPPQTQASMVFNPAFLRKEAVPVAQPAVLPFHILTTSLVDIRLLYNIRPKEGDVRPLAYDSLVCKHGVHQNMPRSLRNLIRGERLNMILQIPELGAIAVGNQAGRVMLLTMTKSVHDKSRYGFRVDWLLPFKSQEDQGLRPEVSLTGMAVSPIQGREMMENYNNGFDPPTGLYADEVRKPSEPPRRHRLFLFYRDHTILSYEITRSPAAKDMGVQDRVILF